MSARVLSQVAEKRGTVFAMFAACKGVTSVEKLSGVRSREQWFLADGAADACCRVKRGFGNSTL